MRSAERRLAWALAVAACLLLSPVRAETPAKLSQTVRVKGDRKLEVVFGPAKSKRVIVYMHGVCGDPHAFKSWAPAASKHATFISMRGDLVCQDRPGRRKWSYDFKGLNRRIDAAIKRVNELRKKRKETALESTEVALVGYSQGARRAEWMAARYPKRFRRVVLISIISEPKITRLHAAHSILLMAGAKDARQHIKDGHRHLKAAGKRVHYLELPGARHGQYGPKALKVMTKGLDWLFKKVP